MKGYKEFLNEYLSFESKEHTDLIKFVKSIKTYMEIYDDNDDRIGKYLSCVYPKIEKFSENDILDSIIMITALDSSRVLLKKILAFKPRRIYTLVNII